MAYATTEEVQARMTRIMSTEEQGVCSNLLNDAAVIIDAYRKDASAEAKQLVSVRMVLRALGDGSDSGIPLGASQGSQSALGYSQSWQFGSGTSGELYIGKLEKKILGTGDKIGSYSPIEELVPKKEEELI